MTFETVVAADFQHPSAVIVERFDAVGVSANVSI
jgi:hypothetical protein